MNQSCHFILFYSVAVVFAHIPFYIIIFFNVVSMDFVEECNSIENCSYSLFVCLSPVLLFLLLVHQ